MPDTTIDIRCYCHGIGDCMLLTLKTVDDKPFRILIDCGLHGATLGGPDKIREVVADLVKFTRTAEFPDGKIDVIVGTHEHWDHLSAFLQEARTFARMAVGEVWLSWAERTDDPQARALDRFKTDTAAALAGTAWRLSALGALPDVRTGMEGLLGFSFGAAGERVRDAREHLRALAPPRYLEPGDVMPLASVPGILVYVLGPPRDAKLLGIEDDPAETYGDASGASSVPLGNALTLLDDRLTVKDDPSAPFDGSCGVRLRDLAAGKWACKDPVLNELIWTHYLGTDAEGRDEDWRRIDGDWLANGMELALQLDSRTNNTSLVLAFEIVKTGRVLLFAADAQIGNWLSWPGLVFKRGKDDSISGADLLRRTVFYKVGHHGSGNATHAATLEVMDQSNLVAFSPTDAAMADHVRWKDFPSAKTAVRLKELTSDRFIQSDAPWVRDPGMPTPVPKSGALQKMMRGAGLYVDLTIG